MKIFLGVLIICFIAGSALANTYIEYTLDGDWIYEEGYEDTLTLSENPSGGITATINVPSGVDDGGLVASRHDLPGFSLDNNIFIELEYSSLTSTITGTTAFLDLCLEVEFFDSEFNRYEIAMNICQTNESRSFETWFGCDGIFDYYDEKPIPAGLSINEGTLGLYFHDNYVSAYFKDVENNLLYPFLDWDISQIAGTYGFRVDNDFEASTLGGGTVLASVNLEQVVYGPDSPVIDIGQTTVTHNWKTVNLSSTLQNAIYILGPPTYHGADPGVVRLQNVTNNSFDIRFQEWLYKDGAHTQENIPYLVISDGRYEMPDGSIWEAGTFSLSGTGAWNSHAFTDTFPSTPALFLTAQTYNGPDPIAVRARNVTNTGFEAALFEEENKMDGHTTEEVGYLAVYSPQLSGTINIDGTDVPYLLQAQSVDHRFVPVLSSDIKLEEEQSKDSEVNHIDETVSILALGDKIFTQDMSSNGGDTIAIRRLAPEYGAAMEWGTVDGVDHNWMKIPLAKEYLNPVVVAKPVSSRGGDPGVIRIRNVCHNSFELRYNEWLYKDGLHVQERVFYLVAEAGERSVAELTVEAGRLNTSKLLADGWEPITFSASFSQTPSIFTSVQTCNGADPVTTRLSNCIAAGFDLTMDEEEAKNDGHTIETIGWVAIEKGTGNTNDNRSVESVP